MRYGHFEEATSANLLIFHREHPQQEHAGHAYVRSTCPRA